MAEKDEEGLNILDGNSEELVPKIDIFMDSCANANIFSLDMMKAIVDSLMNSNLQKISVKGGKKFRFEDDHIIYLTEALMKSNIQLVDLSLTYHRITGFIYLFYLENICCKIKLNINIIIICFFRYWY